MKHALLLAAALFCAGGVPGQAVREQSPLYHGPVTQVQGVFVTPISGVPFSATVVIESKQPLPDGTVETRHTQTLIARDSRGRIRNERHVMVADSFRGVPPLLSVHTFDPATRISYFFNPATHIAEQLIVPEPRTPTVPRDANNEDLGYTTLNGMQAKGTRVTRTIPAAMSGTGKPVQVVDEFWYSEDLHMDLLERHTDMRGGVQTVAILSIQRDEPEPSLFELPEGYKVIDITPPAVAPILRGSGTNP
jgi:hypothetical protein